jgi:galactose mutarotase-like enzyme
MKYKMNNSFISVEIKEFGAELCSLKKNNDDIEYIWQGDEKYWKRHSPILFPIVGKLKEDSYIYKNNEYIMKQHGFARDYKFSMVKHGPNFIEFKLSSNDKMLLIYPFKFDLYLSYELIDESLKVSFKVENKTDGEMIFSIGAHPAFNWPIEYGVKEDYYFEFKNQKSLSKLLITSEGIKNQKKDIKINENRINLTEEIFKNDALIFDDLKNNYVALKNTIDKRSVEVFFNDFPYIGLWSKKFGAPFVCIEPWDGIADFVDHNKNLENKKGIIKINKNEIYNSSYIIKIN